MRTTLPTQFLTLPKTEPSPFVPIKRGYRVILLVLISLQLLIVLIELLNSDQEATSWASLAALAQLVLLYLPIIFYRSSYGWFHPLVFFPLYTLARGLPALIPQISTLFLGGLSELTYTPAENLAIRDWGVENLTWVNARSSVMTIISLVAYYLGFFLLPAPKIPKVDLPPIKNPATKALGILIFSFLVFYIFIDRAGGLGAHFANNWQAGRHESLAGQYYWGFLINLSTVACLIWLAVDPKCFSQPLFWGSMGSSLMISFLFRGSRGGLIYSLIIGIIIWMLRKRRFSSTKVIALILAAVVGIGALGAFRSVIRSKGEIDFNTLLNIQAAIVRSLGDEEEAGELTGGRNGGALPMLAHVPERVDYLYGSTYLAALTIPIPRAIWPEKPGLCGGRAAQAFYFENANWAVPCGSIGEAYWNFGTTGVFVVFFIYGYFHKALAKSLRQYAGHPSALVLYAFLLFYTRPSSTTIVKLMQLLVQTGIILFLWGGIKFFKKRRSTRFS